MPSEKIRRIDRPLRLSEWLKQYAAAILLLLMYIAQSTFNQPSLILVFNVFYEIQEGFVSLTETPPLKELLVWNKHLFLLQCAIWDKQSIN